MPGPERVVGMHFFNPPPMMRLLEVVAGDDASGALATARATGEAMGKHVIVAADGPGFIVNRCNRPFCSRRCGSCRSGSRRRRRSTASAALAAASGWARSS